MANQNGTAYTQLKSVGLFGAGLTSAGTGNTAGGFGAVSNDVLQFEFTNTSANPAVFTSANLVSALGTGIVKAYSLGTFEGTPVSLGWSAGPFAYSATTANPAVITIENSGWESPASLVQANMGVIFLGPTVSSSVITASTLPTPYNSPQASITQYYVKTASGNTMTVSSTSGGTAISGAAGTAITSPTDQSMLMIYGGCPVGFSPFVEYYIYNVSGNTFNLVTTQTGTSGVSGASGAGPGAGILQVHNANQRPFQVAFGTGSGSTYQGIRKNGFRTGIQDGWVASASSVSLDENPQTQWQNVAGATCQAGYVSALFAGDTYSGGWGAAGGISTGSGTAGQQVYEVKMHKDDNGGYETTAERKARLGKELDDLKALSSPTAKDQARKAVVETALNELK